MGRPSDEPGPDDFPGGGYHSEVCCFGGLSFLSCFSPVSPGPGRVTRNMLGWSQQIGLVYGCSVVPSKRGEYFSSLDAAGDLEKKGSYHTAWSVFCGCSCTCSYAYGHVGPHTGERCWPPPDGVWRAIAPLMKPWCTEGEVPTAANLNLYRGWRSCVGWHRDDEPLFGDTAHGSRQHARQ